MVTVDDKFQFNNDEFILLFYTALMLLVGRQEEHHACKKYGVMRYWHGYLSAARCK